jgi:NADH dehydrogenase FAD-containing subunit
LVNGNNSINVLIHATRTTETIPFDFLIICTGGEYRHPIKDIGATTIDERRMSIKQELELIKNAKSVLVVGGGAVGVEVLGELVDMYKEVDSYGGLVMRKRVGVITRNQRLLPYFAEKVGEAAREFLTQYGVEMYFSTAYTERFKDEYKFEHVILCEGYTFRPDYLIGSELFQDCVSARGQIYVNDHMQVTNVNPIVQSQVGATHVAKVFANVFAIGDCCLTRLNEEKTIPPLKECAGIVA